MNLLCITLQLVFELSSFSVIDLKVVVIKW